MVFDRTDPAQLQELKTEIATDPLGLGYAAVIEETGKLLALINNKNPATLVSKPKISAAEVRAATTFDAYDGLLADRQEYLRWITGSNGVEEESLIATPDLRLQLTGSGIPNNSWWAAGERTEMVTAMLAILDVPGSRAEILWGFDTEIKPDDWFAARAS